MFMKNREYLWKKSLIVIAGLLLCFGMTATAAPSVEGNTELTAVTGEIVSAEYTITNDEDMDAAAITISYDKDVLTYMSGSGGNNFSGNGGNGSVQLSSKPGDTTATFSIKFKGKTDEGTSLSVTSCVITVNGKDYILIDTAGMLRKREIESKSVERYSVVRAIAAIKRADVVLIVVDATQPITEQDEKIAGLVHEEGKPSVLVLNKWDAVEKDTGTLKRKTDELKEYLAFMSYFTSVSVSAVTGQRVEKIIEAAKLSYQNATRRIATGLLNELVGQAVAATEPTSRKGRKAKILYVSQPGVCPPLFVFKVNDAKLIHFSYERYLENALRRAFDFSGTQIKLKFIGREE